MQRIFLGVIVIMAAFGTGLGAYGANDDGRLYAGTAKADITPPEEDAVDLLGKKLKLRDHLYARALVLKSGDTSLAIVALDLILFASEKVVAEAKQQWGVDHVILCSSHTHSAMAPKGLIVRPHSGNDWTRAGKDPGEMVDWPSLSEDPWYAATEEKIVAAIGEAASNLFPATISAVRGHFESAYMAHNRRLVLPNGRVRPLWANPNRIPTEPVDPTVGVIRVNDEAGRVRAFLVNYACHPVSSANSGYLHRDFPGSTVDYIEEQLGDQCMAMFVQGAEGDQDPYDMGGGEHGFNVMKQCGISLAKGALRLARSMGPTRGPRGTSIEATESLLKIKYRRGDEFSNVLVSTVVINDEIALFAIPGEPFIQHQIDLTARSPLPNTFLLGLAYSGAGTPFTVYIPTERAVKEGGYGATEASYVEAGAGAKMVKEALASIEAMIE